MSLSILFLIILIVISIFIFNMLLETIQERGFGHFPMKLTLLVCCFLGVHWVLFFINRYPYLPEQVAEDFILPISFTLGILGNLSAIREVNHNRFVAIGLSCFSTLSILFTYFIHGISKM
ncbi:hypothetical protein [Pontibacillus salipaludis]|uniref:Uncharacterized protein n=1 Tax=Pontibacillus salipaludis TaxID=1697394 RepID=A0ABQ1Q3S7_9BACI|nr:hypothetical protein [Pontibacillus salipaludis]GGD11930.1 hypothetical protein GCM10011389_19300 [Pontibacillus salipaludis]